MKVINVMTHQALDAAKWCRDYLGVRFEDDNLFFFGGHSRKRALIPVGHTGTEFISKFQAKADELGIPVITNMKAEELVKDKSGRVVGVKATMDGTEYTFNAKGGVVLATGGFGANPEMVKKYNPKIDERFKTTDAPGTTGEALYMAERAGAELVNMGYIQTYPICDPLSGAIELIADARFDGAIMLNQEGMRFVEELDRRDVLSEAILNQTGQYCWVLWNDNIGKISNTVGTHANEYEAFTKQGVSGDLRRPEVHRRLSRRSRTTSSRRRSSASPTWREKAMTRTSTTARASWTCSRASTTSSRPCRRPTTRWAACASTRRLKS